MQFLNQVIEIYNSVFYISSISVITICPLLPSVKKHYEVTARRECAEIFFFLLNMFIVLRIKNGTL